MFTRFAEQYGGTSAAARALMEAELARQSIGPNRTFSDGTGVPNAFEPLRQKYLRQASAIETSGDLDAQWLSGDAAVARSMREVQPQRPAVGMPSSTREEIQGRGATIRQDVQGRSGSFDQNADVSRTEDGTLKSPRSLLKKSAKQVGNDAKESFDSAKEAVGDLLKRK